MKNSKRAENEVFEGIHKIERYLEDRYRTSPVLVSVQLDPNTYYNDRGFPSRMIALHYSGNQSSIHLNLQRNVGAEHAFTLASGTYVGGLLVHEVEKDFHTLPNILRSLRDDYLGDEGPSAFIKYGNRTFRIRNVRPPLDEELIALDVNPRAAHQFIVGTPPDDKYPRVYDRAYLLKS